MSDEERWTGHPETDADGPEPLAPPPAVKEKLARLPDRPGVYVYKDARGDVIYVGKAASLRSRVRSYWHASRAREGRVQLMLRRVADLETIVCDNEVEALVLESNLIKKHRPRYNVRLRDDKQYPWLRIDLAEKWPRLLIVRQRRDDGARYFGPYADAGALKATVAVLRRVFPYRTCSDRRLAQGGRPCLYYHIRRCPAPCVGYVTEEAYMREMRRLVEFLEGRDASLLRSLEEEMEAAAEALEFERAADLRDRIRALREVGESQKVVLRRVADRDVVALARRGDLIAAQVFFVREGRVEGRESFLLQAGVDESPTAAMAAFLEQYYTDGAAVPGEVLVDVEPEGRATLEAYLSRQRGRRVVIRRPLRGEARRLMDLVRENAEERLKEELWRRERARDDAQAALEELQEALGLPEPPLRIECFDISNIQGSHIVAAMTVFEDGRPRPSEYRRFRIQTVSGRPDDFASMQEVIFRRFRRAREDASGKWSRLPDLVIIDGGKGQLSAAMEALRALGFDDIPAFALAKEEELLFAPGRGEPIELPRHSAALHLLQHIRDEAHRFGLEYHRRLRSGSALRSRLDDIPGIGPKRRRALMKAFGTPEAILAAGPEAVAALPGFHRKLAEAVCAALADGRIPPPAAEGGGAGRAAGRLSPPAAERVAETRPIRPTAGGRAAESRAPRRANRDQAED
ncbi:MAG: excinuclease ABC subunit UvrC [Firmicutes bacterium]|nr:excinuclease ABC subunit UvrC [Bacillota bacterium]